MQKPNGYDSTKAFTPDEWYDLDELKGHLAEELTPSKDGFYVCPLCGSGTGRNQTGALKLYGDGYTKDYWKCHKCGKSGDIVDLVSLRDGIDSSEATKQLIRKYKPSKSNKAPETKKGSYPLAGLDMSSAPVAQASAGSNDQPPARSFAGQLAAWHTALKGSAGEEYLRRRGITEESMDRFNLGFATDRKGRPAVVFPYNTQGTYYSMRVIRDDLPDAEKHDMPKTAEAGKEPLFNQAALRQDAPCFVVESQLCAISIMQEGGSAVALCGAGKWKKVIEQNPSAFLILSLDNDDTGTAKQAELAEALREKDIPFLEYNVSGDYCKDPNELLQENPDALRGSVAAAVEIVRAMRESEADKARKEYEAQTAAASFNDYISFLDKTGERPPIPTGFNSLDRVLNGGLSAGLYIMGAISSLGKTSWMLHMADNIAEAGYDVLYFSLEMSRYELISKSISRLTFNVSEDKNNALDTFEVLNSRGKRSFSFGQNAALSRAFKLYQEGPGKHIWIREGVGNFGVDTIAADVENHIKVTGRFPVVFVDYLQILAPVDPKSTDKQNTDRAVVELKRLSRKYDIPVFCISSLNRTSYTEPIGTAAFKESGAIEYGSDVLLGLQVLGMDYEQGEKSNGHAARVRKLLESAEKAEQIDVHVKILKNRNGRRASVKLSFNKPFNVFHDIPGEFSSFYGDTPYDGDSAEDDDDPI